jgi:hypothetical protein
MGGLKGEPFDPLLHVLGMLRPAVLTGQSKECGGNAHRVGLDTVEFEALAKLVERSLGSHIGLSERDGCAAFGDYFIIPSQPAHRSLG